MRFCHVFTNQNVLDIQYVLGKVTLFQIPGLMLMLCHFYALSKRNCSSVVYCFLKFTVKKMVLILIFFPSHLDIMTFKINGRAPFAIGGVIVNCRR